MKTKFVVAYEAVLNGRLYYSVGSFYFETEKEAEEYAKKFIENSDTFDRYMIFDIIPF